MSKDAPSERTSQQRGPRDHAREAFSFAAADGGVRARGGRLPN